MKIVSYTDEEGRRWATQLPEEMPDSEAAKGLPLGPPSLTPLGLPLEVEVRLHNHLFDRELFTEKAVRSNRQSVIGAVMATFKVDAQKIIDLYATPATPRPKKPPKEKKAPEEPAKRTSGGRSLSAPAKS